MVQRIPRKKFNHSSGDDGEGRAPTMLATLANPPARTRESHNLPPVMYHALYLPSKAQGKGAQSTTEEYFRATAAARKGSYHALQQADDNIHPSRHFSGPAREPRAIRNLAREAIRNAAAAKRLTEANTYVNQRNLNARRDNENDRNANLACRLCRGSVPGCRRCKDLTEKGEGEPAIKPEPEDQGFFTTLDEPQFIAKRVSAQNPIEKQVETELMNSVANLRKFVRAQQRVDSQKISLVHKQMLFLDARDEAGATNTGLPHKQLQNEPEMTSSELSDDSSSIRSSLARAAVIAQDIWDEAIPSTPRALVAPKMSEKELMKKKEEEKKAMLEAGARSRAHKVELARKAEAAEKVRQMKNLQMAKEQEQDEKTKQREEKAARKLQRAATKAQALKDYDSDSDMVPTPPRPRDAHSKNEVLMSDMPHVVDWSKITSAAQLDALTEQQRVAAFQKTGEDAWTSNFNQENVAPKRLKKPPRHNKRAHETGLAHPPKRAAAAPDDLMAAACMESNPPVFTTDLPFLNSSTRTFDIFNSPLASSAAPRSKSTQFEPTQKQRLPPHLMDKPQVVRSVTPPKVWKRHQFTLDPETGELSAKDANTKVARFIAAASVIGGNLISQGSADNIATANSLAEAEHTVRRKLNASILSMAHIRSGKFTSNIVKPVVVKAMLMPQQEQHQDIIFHDMKKKEQPSIIMAQVSKSCRRDAVAQAKVINDACFTKVNAPGYKLGEQGQQQVQLETMEDVYKLPPETEDSDESGCATM